MSQRNIYYFIRACSRGDYRKASRCYPFGYDVNQPMYYVGDGNYDFYTFHAHERQYFPYFMYPMMTPIQQAKCETIYPLEAAINSASSKMISELVLKYGLRLDYFMQGENDMDISRPNVVATILSLGFQIPFSWNLMQWMYINEFRNTQYWSQYKDLVSSITRERLQYMFSNRMFPTILPCSVPNIDKELSTKYMKYIIACHNIHTYDDAIQYHIKTICSHGCYLMMPVMDSVPTLQELCLKTILLCKMDTSSLPEMALYSAYNRYVDTVGDSWALSYDDILPIPNGNAKN